MGNPIFGANPEGNYSGNLPTSFGNGGRESMFGPDGNIKDNMGNVADTGSLKVQAIKDVLEAKVLTEVAKTQIFSPLATSVSLAPNHGKWIKQYVWYPVLDDRNKNDQGIDANGVTYENGNMYGSSKDITTILGKLPVLNHEHGGRYNRIGNTRTMIEGTISELGFFFEYTRDEIMFDSDAEIYSRFTKNALEAASEVCEDVLQIDLINNAGQKYYCGTATSKETMDENSVITYKDFSRLSKILVDAHVDKHYKMFTGSRNFDTRTVSGGWTIYCGKELRNTFQMMKDYHDRPAFVPIEQYAAGADTVPYEVGRIGEFRIVEVPEMTHWEAIGKEVSSDTTPTCEVGTASDGKTKYNVYPMLIIGNESFTTITFRSNGKNDKYTIMSKKPGMETMSREDPYGRSGIWSIQWFYGFMTLRPERLVCIHTVAKV